MNSQTFAQTIELSHKSSENETHIFSVKILPESPVFEGHFPHIPILPGVAMVATVKNALRKILHQNVSMTSASAIKFLVPINPTEVPQVELVLKATTAEGSTKVDAALKNDDTTFFKIKAIYA